MARRNKEHVSSPHFQPIAFAGELRDPQTKLVRFGAREYNAQTGRWSLADPIGFEGGDEKLYEYASGDPINHSDVDGTQSKGQQLNLGLGYTGRLDRFSQGGVASHETHVQL